MPTCDYCDLAVPTGAADCPHCHAPRDPSGDRPEPPAVAADAAGRPAPAVTAAAEPGQTGEEPPSVERVLRSLQQGDAGGVAAGLQDLAKSGQLDLGKLASDLGAGGQGKGLDLGQLARSVTSGGGQSSNVLQALGKQAGLGKLLGSATTALRSPAGLAVSGAALAAAGIGAGVLLARTPKGQAVGAGIKDAIGKVLPGGSGGVGSQLGSLLGGGAGTSPEDAAQYRHAAEQLPPARADQLAEGLMVLARWEGDEWRAGQIGWVDGGQARVTFESGFERWCQPADLRLAPAPGEPPAPPPAPEPAAAQVGSDAAPRPEPAWAPSPEPAAPSRRTPSLWDDEPVRQDGAFGVNEMVEVEVSGGPALRAEVLEAGAGRVRVRLATGQELWLEAGAVKKLGW